MTSEEFIKVFDTIAEAPRGVGQLRELVLQLAVRGRLVPQESEPESANLLLKRIVMESEQARKSRVSIEYEPASTIALPTTWESVHIGDAMDLINGRAFKPAEWSTTGIPIVRIQNLNDANAAYNYCGFDVAEKFYIGTGDLLISWSGTPGTSFGAFIWNGGPAVLNQHIFRCEPRADAFFVPYLRLAINARLSEMIERAHGGVGLRHITKGKLQGLRIALPPLAEQHRIVAKVDELLGFIDQLEAARTRREELRSAARDSALHALRNATTTEEVKDARTRIAERMEELFTTSADLAPLRDTVLQLGVRGRLVPQDPNDEPARVLLDRIREERAQSIPAKQIRQQRQREPITCSQLKAPEGWKHVYLGDVIDLEYGKSLPQKDRKESGDVPVYGSNGIVGQHDVALVSGSCIVVGRKGSAGAVTLARTPCWPIDTTYFVRPHGGMSLKYTSLMLACARLEELDRATAIPGLNREEAYLRKALLPPLAEQHRIVVKVDELMGLIDRLEKHLVVKGESHEALAAAATIVV